jgi:hypothetical protein
VEALIVEETLEGDRLREMVEAFERQSDRDVPTAASAAIR